MHSGLVISGQNDRPLYLQIVDQVRRLVAVGDWAPGAELPSIRGLAAELSVSVITVKRAYAELEREGVIVTEHGKGTFVSTARFLPQTEPVRERIAENVRAAVDLARTLGWERTELDGVVSTTWGDTASQSVGRAKARGPETEAERGTGVERETEPPRKRKTERGPETEAERGTGVEREMESPRKRKTERER